jgi:hypothetical protein
MIEKAKAIYQGSNSPSTKRGNLIPFSSKDSDSDRTAILHIKEVIDNTTYTIFTGYQKELLSEPITYIIPAVWGKIKQGRLRDSQKEINRTIDSMIVDIMDELEFDSLKDVQRFAVEYFLRGLVISKITYLIEAFKKRPAETMKPLEKDVPFG